MSRTVGKTPMFPDIAGAERTPPRPATGVLPRQELAREIERGMLVAEEPIDAAQIQPASVDLRLGARAWRVRASFLPGAGNTVAGKIDAFGMHEIDLEGGAVLEKGCVYVVELEERTSIPRTLTGFANPKSSTGRLDVFTRLIADGAAEFDTVAGGYHGPLYAEIVPRTFSILVRRGSRLCQLRVRRGTPPMPHVEMRARQRDVPLIDVPADDATIREDRIAVTLDLAPADGVAGFRARKHAHVIDVDARDRYDPQDFWEPIAPRAGARIVLDPDDFHILATVERVRIPPDMAAEMVAYDTMVGEFRVHYAGFFDPGFGYGPGPGAKAVLEVRSHDVPFVLEHGRIIGWLRFEKVAGEPDRLYGGAIGSSYQGQGLKLGRQFRAWTP